MEVTATTIDGIPVTEPARTLLDLATVEPEDVIERFLDDALRRRLVSIAFLERWLADPQRRRHRSARILQRLVDERARGNAIEALGWRILGVTAAHLERDPDAVIAWIERALTKS